MSAFGTAVAQIVVGLIETLFGRKLFWLFVAIGGFLVGWFLAPAIWTTFHETGALALWVRLVIGLAAAVILGFAAFKFTRIMVALAGFFIFAAAAILAVNYFGGNGTLATGTRNYWIVYVVGGVVGAIIMGLLFDWALIVLTSLFGAGATVDGILYFVNRHPTAAHPAPAKWIEGVAAVVLFVIGLTVQIAMRRRKLGKAS
jgi:Domain of unknown function (DUF4203)